MNLVESGHEHRAAELRAPGGGRGRFVRKGLQSQRDRGETAPPGGEEVELSLGLGRSWNPSLHDPGGGAVEKDGLLQSSQHCQVGSGFTY